MAVIERFVGSALIPHPQRGDKRFLRDRSGAVVPHPRDGDVVAADFALRQLTYMEMILDCADARDAVLALWSNGPSHEQPARATETCRPLDRVRPGVWENADGLIRPPVGLPARAPSVVSAAGGVSITERAAAQAEACRRMAEAQALWEAAATEEGWAKWCGEE